MAVLHLQLEIDSEVHPELHALLSSLTRQASAVERIRQLASTGLIWERLRVSGQPHVSTLDVIPSLQADQNRNAEALAAPRSTKPAEALEAARSDVPTLSDVIEVNELPKAARAGMKEAKQAAKPSSRAVAASAAAANDSLEGVARASGGPSPSPTARSAPGTYGRESAPSEKLRDRPRPSAETATRALNPAVLSPPTRAPGTRSRLLRMKEKGLFSNG